MLHRVQIFGQNQNLLAGSDQEQQSGTAARMYIVLLSLALYSGCHGFKAYWWAWTLNSSQAYTGILVSDR